MMVGILETATRKYVAKIGTRCGGISENLFVCSYDILNYNENILQINSPIYWSYFSKNSFWIIIEQNKNWRTSLMFVYAKYSRYTRIMIYADYKITN